MMCKEESYCIKWKGYEGAVMGCLEGLHREDFSDVSIVCEEGASIQAHKLILSACSPYFLQIFKENPCPHPLIILNDVPKDILNGLITYMYEGSVSLSEKRVPLFLKAAKDLRIKGIGGEGEKEPPNNLSILASAAAFAKHKSLTTKRVAAPDYRVPKYSPPSQRLKEEENQENMEVHPPTSQPTTTTTNTNNNSICKHQSIPHPSSTLLTIPDPNVFISQENRAALVSNSSCSNSSRNTMNPTSMELSNKAPPSPTPLEDNTPTVILNNNNNNNNTSDALLAPLTSAATSEQMAALLGPSWKSRQPRMCPYCKRMFSNKFNLKQHILNMHTVGRELQCEQCHKKVKNKWYLRRHHVTHHGAPLKK